MSYFTTFMQKASCAAAAEQSAAAASAWTSFRITVDTVLGAGSIFVVRAILGVIAGIVEFAAGLGIAAIGMGNRSVTACRAL